MNVNDHYSAIVVGAGPAGIMAARFAAARGSVLLVDCSELPRDKSCGGMLNEYSQAFFAELGEQVPKKMFCDPEWIRFRYFDWDRDIRKKTSLNFANVQRSAFDEWLLGLLPANVEVHGGVRFSGCTQDADGVDVDLRDASGPDAPARTVRCGYLVGCDGPRSQVRRSLPVPRLALYRTLQDYLPLKRGLEPYFDCLYARGIGADYGYGYVIPKGDLAIVGSVFFPNTRGNHVLHDKAVRLYSSYYPYETEHVKREAWTAVQVRSTRDIAAGHGRVLLAGEAAGIMSPSSGEGISFALNSGKLAGQALVAALGEGGGALALYRDSLVSIKRNIARRLRYFPIMNSNWGKWLGGNMPGGVIDKFTHKI